MKASYYRFLIKVSLLLIIVPLGSAIITATGAFGNDPGGRVNRMDFVAAGFGVLATIVSVARLRRFESKR